MKSKETFESLLESFRYHYNLSTVFDDFLTISIAACGRNLSTGLSYDEELYLKTIEPYKDDPLRHNFRKMFASLTLEMTEKKIKGDGNDILGEYYKANLAKQGLSQFFTPYPICSFMARSVLDESEKNFPGRPLRSVDPARGSGRMLVVTAQESSKKHEYFGVDIDQTCVKMTALNLFLNGIFNSEVLCANALLPQEFRGSYIISVLPFGVFRIAEKEKSFLWHLMNQKIASNESKNEEKEYEWGKGKPAGPQLEFF
jgi:type I restriction-modification system DNA methylase subunit